MENKENFSDKYLKSNFVIRKLIENFYRQIEKILYGVGVEKILEVGCGPGFSAQYLEGILKSKNFEASEYKKDLAEEAQKRNPEIKIQQESIYELKRENDSFDLVIALEVLEHLDNPIAALKELKRVTAKFCLISVPNEPLWRILNFCRLRYFKNFGNTPGHVQHWSKKQFVQFLSEYFKIRQIAVSLPWIIVLVEK